MKKLIVLIDDDMDFLKLIALKLTREGHQVQALLNGEDLLDTVAENTPDLFIIDINMPYMSGNALCKILKHNSSTKAVPILIFSGNENIKSISNACGADGFIPKPYNATDFDVQLQRFL